MRKLLQTIAPFVIVIAIWEVVAVAGAFPESLFPGVDKVFSALADRAASGTLLIDVGASMYRFIFGYGIAAISGIVLGLLLGSFKPAWVFANPLVQFLRPISPMAWLPFVVLWVGIGDVPAIVVIFLAAFFPVLLSTETAVERVNPVYLKVSRNFGLKRHQIILRVVLPAVFPAIAGGLKLAVGTAWIFLVAGEMVGAQSGLGFLIVDARNNLQMDVLLAAIVAIGIIGVLLNWIIGVFEQRIDEVWGSRA